MARFDYRSEKRLEIVGFVALGYKEDTHRWLALLNALLPS